MASALFSAGKRVFIPSADANGGSEELLAEQTGRLMQRLNDAAENNVFVDGGDVLQLGGEMFVGLSDRSTPQGAAYLASAFGSAGSQSGVSQVAALPIAHLHSKQGSLHLKSIITRVGQNAVAVPDSEVRCARSCLPA